MFLTVHAATGVIIGQTTNSLPFAFIFGFIFHFLMDMIPHGDKSLIDLTKGRKAKIRFMAGIASIDAVIMGLFLIFIFNRSFDLNYLPIAAGIAGSIIPDFFHGLAELTNGKIKFLKKFHKIHHALHYFPLFKNFDPNLKTGIIMQIIILALLTNLII